MTPLRFTHYEIKYEPAQVQRSLEAAAATIAMRIRG
jgi:hypothetical protein